MIYSSSKSILSYYALILLEKCRHLTQLMQLQAFLIAIGEGRSQFFAFKLVRFCTWTLADISYARFIFDRVESPNVFLCTAMITAYASQPQFHRSAFIFYRDMLCRGRPRPDKFIYTQVLKSCPEAVACCGTNQVHSQIVRSGFGQCPVVQTSLVDSYSRFCASHMGIARQVFDEMSEKSVACWTALISGYSRSGQIGDAMSVFDEMPVSDTPSWNAVISGCTQNGLFFEAISLFKSMLLHRIGDVHGCNLPNHITLACVLSSCAHIGMLQLGRCIHGYVYRNGFGLDMFTLSSLVDMYGKCGNMKTAEAVFSTAPSKDLAMWNSMIHCLGMHGKCGSAISVFEEMLECEDDIKPNELTFLGLLIACTHGGLVDKGRFFFKLMSTAYGIVPGIEHYGCLIDLLVRAGQLDEAMDVVNRMTVEPDVVVWGSLLNGCKIHGRTDLAENAVKKLVEMDPDNGGYGMMLANVYVELGKWDESRNVRKDLKEQNSYKTLGCSWVEVDNQFHGFSALDRAHPRNEEIYHMLETTAKAVGVISTAR